MRYPGSWPFPMTEKPERKTSNHAHVKQRTVFCEGMPSRHKVSGRLLKAAETGNPRVVIEIGGVVGAEPGSENSLGIGMVCVCPSDRYRDQICEL
jgi:hypothetical protein